jgi:tyrosinase
MHRITRRSLVAAALGSISLPEWLARQATAQTAKVRYNVASPQGQQMLAKYQQAVGTMMQTSAGDPRSWTFQWYTHWVNGDTDKNSEIARIFGSQLSANQALAQDMWSTCQAHGDNEDENMFLPWHRMFVYYFESIVAGVLNDPTFTLPYWDYSSPATAALPAAFRASGSPLFRQTRNSGPNRGAAMPASQSALDALNESSFGPQGAAQGFCATLDFGLHGNVHVWIGNSQGMGNVPYAANDPIFWLHHCNIDRLWASWNQGGGQNPGGTWPSQSFTFADGNGQRITAQVANVADTSQLGYSYDALEPVTVTPAVTSAAGPTVFLQSVPPVAAVPVAGGGIPLSAGPVHISMAPVARGAVPIDLTERFKALPPARRLLLVLRDLTAAAQPGVTYQVYLDLPPNATPSPESANFVGTINFFAAAAMNTMPGMTMPAPRRTVSLDITSKAKTLAAQGQLNPTPAVTIVPADAPADAARPVVGQVQLVEQ